MTKGALPFRERRRSSLRLRVVMAILLVAFGPALLVFVWSQFDRNVLGRMPRIVNDTAARAASVVAREPLDEATLRDLARTYHVRVRVLDVARDATDFDDDSDQPDKPFDRVEAFFLGSATPPRLRDVDATRGPLLPRPDVQEALRTGAYAACAYDPVLSCEDIHSVATLAGTKVVSVEASSRRSVFAVYGLRHQLLRLSLVTAPLSFLLALYTAKRVVRPIEHLRKQALEKTRVASPAAPLDPERPDEVGVLADAFNALLAALDSKRVQNEAFVADLVHEMKNPVAAIRAAAESLGAGAVEKERAERLARILGDSAAKLDRVVTQFLELARVEAGMPNEERSRVDLGALLSAAVERHRADVRHAGVDFRVIRSEGRASCAVDGVEHRLEALFGALIENAASFAAPGGEVAVTVEAREDEVRVAVSDTGPGIAEADLPRVFERFFTTRGRERGTGLGLALVQAVAEAHGGTVRVSSAAGKGATFDVRLPR